MCSGCRRARAHRHKNSKKQSNLGCLPACSLSTAICPRAPRVPPQSPQSTPAPGRKRMEGLRFLAAFQAAFDRWASSSSSSRSLLQARLGREEGREGLMPLGTMELGHRGHRHRTQWGRLETLQRPEEFNEMGASSPCGQQIPSFLCSFYPG